MGVAHIEAVPVAQTDRLALCEELWLGDRVLKPQLVGVTELVANAVAEA